MSDPYFIRIRTVYDKKTPIVKAVMKWKKVFTASETSLTLEQLRWRLSQADSIGENKEEYLMAINAIENREGTL